ncbi:hypothetical protein CRG98_018148 [Punica granatum]|uniref:Uncharacterized protein n=1 Tax=Punica granatum TaxID=22663 RepID=A0A2I0JYS4_PUNGR|nr:hypothetical protein CRG98_018148 [Punica granatum]
MEMYTTCNSRGLPTSKGLPRWSSISRLGLPALSEETDDPRGSLAYYPQFGGSQPTGILKLKRLGAPPSATNPLIGVAGLLYAGPLP